MPEFTHASELPFSAQEVLAWHTRPGAFERLLPPWEPVEVEAREGGILEGGTVTLRVGIGPARVRWVARHGPLAPGVGFRDEQVEGPFARWEHEHRMEPLGADRCRLVDHVTYEPPLGPVGDLAEGLAIRPRLERQFRYRHATLADDLAAHRAAALPPQTVAITGASGLVGTALTALLTSGGHVVRPVVRRAPQAGEIGWDPGAGRLAPGDLAGVDAVVHLAGESVDGRWTDEKKRRIRESRIAGTRLLAEAIAQASPRPRVLVSASAVGIYGDRGDERLLEDAAPGRDFLAEVGQAWEAAAAPASGAGVRVVHPRFGMVLSPGGGALARMLTPFRAGVGGRLGDGRQWMSWISLDDAIGLCLHALATDALHGPVNAVAPGAVRNRVFTEVLGEVLGRPTILPAPAPALRLAFGEMADALLLASTRVEPGVAEATGYRFRHPDLRAALRHLLGR